MMAELAPQSSDGSYVRPTYGFKGQLGTAEFPLEEGRYHMYVSTFSPLREAPYGMLMVCVCVCVQLCGQCVPVVPPRDAGPRPERPQPGPGVVQQHG
jgi:hypothetical protein